MSELEKAIQCRSVALRSWAEVATYDWGDEFACKEIRKLADSFLDKHPEHLIDLTKLSSSDLEELNFGKWEEDSPLRLIPLWLYPFCDKSVEVTSIFGEKLKLSEADTDNRFGYLAFGINKNKETDGKQA